MDTDKILEELAKQTELLKSIDGSMPYSNEERFEKIEQTLDKVLEQLYSMTNYLTDIKKNTSQ